MKGVCVCVIPHDRFLRINRTLKETVEGKGKSAQNPSLRTELISSRCNLKQVYYITRRYSYGIALHLNRNLMTIKVFHRAKYKLNLKVN